MIEKLKQRTIDELAKLPKEIQEDINSLDWSSLSETIGKKYLPNEREIDELQAEILLVLIGIEKIDNLKTNIEINVDLTPRIASQIADELVEQIFNPIANKIEESIKNHLEYKNISWDQTVNFIVSGGDYSVFIKKIENKNVPKPKVEYREAI